MKNYPPYPDYPTIRIDGLTLEQVIARYIVALDLLTDVRSDCEITVKRRPTKGLIARIDKYLENELSQEEIENWLKGKYERAKATQ